jgi:hypothetical protein
MPLLGQPIKQLFEFSSWSGHRSLKRREGRALLVAKRCRPVPLTIPALKLRSRYSNPSR